MTELLFQVDLQQRGVEYSQLFRKFEHMRAALLEPMPPMEKDTSMLDEDAVRVNGEAGSNGVAPAQGAGDGVTLLGGVEAASSGGNDLLVLMGDGSLTGGTPSATAAPPPSATTDNASLLDLLGDLDLSASSSAAASGAPSSMGPSILGGGGGGETSVLPSGAPSANGGSNPLDGILGPDLANSTSPAGNNLGDLLAGLPGSGPAANNGSKLPPLTFYEQNGLSISMHFGEIGGGGPVNITLEAINNNSAPISEFTFQAAVPKSMQLELQLISSPSIPPSGGKATLQMKVQNPQRVAMKMRVRLSYVLGGGPKTFHEGEVGNFPPALWTS